MALSRKARLKRSSAAGCEPRAVPPTPQTRAKLRRDVIATLLDKGQLGQPHAEAAAEIRTVFEAVGRGMFPASRLGIDTAALPERRKAGHDFLDRMSAGECRAWERRYLPWTKALALTIASGLPGVRWLQLVLDVVIDNASLREVERRYRLRHGTAIEYLRQGLEIYGR